MTSFEKAIIKKATKILQDQREYLRWLSNCDTSEEDMEIAFHRACGYAHGYETLGFFTGAEALEWVQHFADACEGR